MSLDANRLRKAVRAAVRTFWRVRTHQKASQSRRGTKDHGSRGAVTGGAQMNGFVALLGQVVRRAGMQNAAIHESKALELPGFFRPTKQWDMLMVQGETLVAAIETKSQVGPSFGNNFNNRPEEAIGSAVDFWTAYRKGAFSRGPRPWLGYVFLLEDCPRSRSPVRVSEPHFDVFPEFQDASYMERYELLCRKLLRERHYDSVAFLTTSRHGGAKGAYREPAEDLGILPLAASLAGHVSAHIACQKGRSR